MVNFGALIATQLSACKADERVSGLLEVDEEEEKFEACCPKNIRNRSL